LAEMAGAPWDVSRCERSTATRRDEAAHVRPSGARHRLGRRLAALIEEARRLGYRRICLDTLRSCRPPRRSTRRWVSSSIAPYQANPVVGALHGARALAQPVETKPKSTSEGVAATASQSGWPAARFPLTAPTPRSAKGATASDRAPPTQSTAAAAGDRRAR
jgi:hypothetical protein